jgi:hypothetical protein
LTKKIRKILRQPKFCLLTRNKWDSSFGDKNVKKTFRNIAKNLPRFSIRKGTTK